MSFEYTEKNWLGTQVPRTIEIESCIDCPFHKILPDPDPYDSFNADDEAVICLKSQKEPQTIGWGNYSGGEPMITVACRPYNLRNETTPVPNWCPIRSGFSIKFNIKDNSN